MLFITNTISNEEYEKVENFFEDYENISTEVVEAPVIDQKVNKYLNSLVTNCYKKSVNDIANTKLNNRVVRKRNFQQVMQESFFYGANRFGNNFIA